MRETAELAAVDDLRSYRIRVRFAWLLVLSSAVTGFAAAYTESRVAAGVAAAFAALAAGAGLFNLTHSP